MQEKKVNKVSMQHEKDFDNIIPRFGYCDMDDVMKKEVVEVCRESCKMQHENELKYYKDMAIHVKTNLDKKLKGTWHVIIGKPYFTSNIFRHQLRLIR